MNQNEIYRKRNNINAYLQSFRLREAFRELYLIIDSVNNWQLRTRLEEIETSYKYMIEYMIQGVKDPQQQKIYNKTLAETYSITDNVVRELLSTDSNTQYFSLLRYHKATNSIGISPLLCDYEKLCNDTSLYNSLDDAKKSLEHTKAQQLHKENMLRDIFNRVWVSYPISQADYNTLNIYICNGESDTNSVLTLISAITLASLEYFDEKLLYILIDAYAKSDNNYIKMRALMGMILVLYKYRERITYYDNITARIDNVKDTPGFEDDVKRAFLQLIQSRDTEKINRKMQDELLPQMLKLSPKIYNNILDKESLKDLANAEENPAWKEILDKEGISDKMMELNDMQMEGGDVFMSTFSHLKNFPFFYDEINWFLPFDSAHSSVSHIVNSNGEYKNFGTIIEKADYFCNSDKYSFCLSLSHVPEEQRRMMFSQFDAQAEMIKEEKNEEIIKPNKQRDTILNKYSQDLYRFFKLNRRKNEFYDPFKTPLNLLQIPLFESIFTDTENLKLIGECYFRKEYFEDALNIYLQIDKVSEPSAEVFQKIGYCYQNIGNNADALKYYLKADMMVSDDIWTVKKIAACYRMLKNNEKALEYYKHADTIKPDNMSVTLNIGHCLLELNRYGEALKYYFKIEYLSKNAKKSWRPIAWCSFITGDYAQSETYYNKIEQEDTATAQDYLNHGHLKLVTGDTKEAVRYYKKSISCNNNDISDFISSMNQDMKILREAGIDTANIPLIEDKLIYELG